MGIPLPHRGAARSLTFVTGHTKEGRPELDFAALARIGGTLAVDMGALARPALGAGLIAAGMNPPTPAALIENEGSAACRLARGTLAGLAGYGGPSPSPALLLLGKAVALAQLPAQPAMQAALA